MLDFIGNSWTLLEAYWATSALADTSLSFSSVISSAVAESWLWSNSNGLNFLTSPKQNTCKLKYWVCWLDWEMCWTNLYQWKLLFWTEEIVTAHIQLCGLLPWKPCVMCSTFFSVCARWIRIHSEIMQFWAETTRSKSWPESKSFRQCETGG